MYNKLYIGGNSSIGSDIALALFLNAIKGLWAHQGFIELSITKYGINNSQVNATFEKYTKGIGDTKCN